MRCLDVMLPLPPDRLDSTNLSLLEQLGCILSERSWLVLIGRRMGDGTFPPYIIIRALRHVGKPYDFNFDVESKERVYCSKLV